MNYGCNGRRAVISGGTSGIGLAAARTLWRTARKCGFGAHGTAAALAELKENYGEKCIYTM